MSRSLRRRTRAAIAVTGLVVASLGAGSAHADPGNGQSGSHHATPATGHKPTKPATHPTRPGKPHPATPHPGQHAGHHTGQHTGHHTGTTSAPGHGAGGNGNGNGHGHGGDPAGNNGTVKIAPLGSLDSIPNNTPHVGCSFEVEWYGFDEGPDVVSDVTFSMQAPTKDVGLSVAGDPSVFVGGDPATGAGTPTGLDGRETYTLSFDGAPAAQGYHVRLTVHTPRSLGNDTKTKVFWVQPCDSTPSTPGTTGTGTSGGSGTGAAGGPAPATSPDTALLDANGTAPAAGTVGDTSAPTGSAAVPTAVDAGQGGHRSVADWVRSPVPLAVIGLGLLLAVGALVLRRRARA